MMNNMGIDESQIDNVADDIDSMMDNIQKGDMTELTDSINALQEAAQNGDIPDVVDENNDESNKDDNGEKPQETNKSATNTPDLMNFLKTFGKMMGNMPLPNIRPVNNQQTNNNGSNEKTKSEEKTNPEEEKVFSLKKFKFLSQYGIDLNDKAKNGLLDNVVGRDRETERVIQILNRRTKNNPALIGEPGVGKTAIAEGLALRIVRKEVPYKLLEKVVVMLDLTSVVAGTQFRGQFEGRMKGIIDEVKKAGNIILVIDEVHSIIGAGEAEGSLNAANILKPALSRGEIQVIGTTTLKEYRKYIEKDGALERRFQPVMVEEPSIEATIAILKGIRETYEDYHCVTIDDGIVESAVKLSERYISDRFLPDKAIDVLDEACSRANLRNHIPEEVDKLKQRLADISKKIETLEAKVIEIQNAPSVKQDNGDETQVVDNENIDIFRDLAEAKSERAKIQEQVNNIIGNDNKRNTYIPVLYDDVAKVIETWTGIPVNMISAEEAAKLLTLEDRLKAKVIGQDNAVSVVSRAIRRNRSGFRKHNKPSSFIFAGPTGVGKTHLVNQLAIELFGTTESLIRLDMSEYMEKHTVSKLIGSPPGYVGYDEAGQLTEKVRRHPYSVILFDEIEKAHSDVFNMLLQILDDGRLTDSQGRVVNFENTVIILTTNAYGKNSGVNVGFSSDSQGDAQKNAEAALKKIFRPEFLNRIDEIVLFNSLSHDSLVKIVELMLSDVVEQLLSRNIGVKVTDSAVELIAKEGFEEEYGARPLRRYIQKNIEDILAEKALRGELNDIKRVVVDVENGKIVIQEKILDLQ